MYQSAFNNRLAIVTGASSGIGLATTPQPLASGVRVLAMSRQMGQLKALKQRYTGQLTWLAGDITQQEDLERLAQAARQNGPVHHVVPNAGIARLGRGLDSAVFEEQWAVNGAGAIDTLAALRPTLADSASVVFIGTFLSKLTFPGLAAYIATKSTLTAQARTLTTELACNGVLINIASPGPTATAIWQTLGLAEAELGHVAATVNQRLIGGSFLEPEAVADVIVFLLSDAARGIYGQEIIIDKGYTLG
ncbi:SDR family oxidoreductase (plasmid) [Pseudomonas luteola]|uniref:SDR family NAD(P)-dependent oxidoreductase n=1 Tax=Pseudomonas luteola TaxID=47886 RepID=UPI003DA166FB